MTAHNMTDDELVEMLKLAEAHGSAAAAARVIGIPASTMRARVNQAKTRGLTAATELERSREEENKTLKRKLRIAQRDADTSEAIRSQIFDLAENPPNPPKWLAKTTKLKKKHDCDIPMTIWSDWHWGEVVKAGEVGGVNEYNSEIARNRVQILVDKTISLVSRHMPCSNSPGIVVMLGGDMINGEIHDELRETNDDYVLSSLLDLQDVLCSAITQMADHFGQVFVPCVVGNHGRTTIKPRCKGKVFTNYEWNMYCQLERHFKNDKRVTIYVPGETDAHFTVAGHRFLLSHGDSLGARGGDGIIGAIGPIMRGALKTWKSESQINRDFDTIVMGHWHQYLTVPGIIVNNSLKGYDEFARLVLRAPARAASQALWGVHPKWGITSRWEINVQDPIVAAANDIPWVALKEE